MSEFARALNEEVREKAVDGNPYATEIECFADAVLEMFSEAGVIEDPEVCVRGGRLGRANWEIAGWAFPPSDDEDLSSLSILAVLHNDDPETPPASAEELRRRFELAVHFITSMLDGRADDLEPAADAAALGRIIHERRKKLKRIEVHIATDGLTQRLKSIDSVEVSKVEVTCAIWDIERLSRLSDPKQEEIEIDVLDVNHGSGLPCLRVPEDDPHYDAYLCVVPGTLLFHAYEKYGQRLLEQNVRAFLSATGKVNKGIRETIHGNPDRFFAYNNGLALTARSVEVRRRPDGHEEITRIVGLQVVNGGQTTASIHRAVKVDGAANSVAKVFVQGKLVVVTTEDEDHDGFIELVRSISKFANKQNAVKDDDLEANQPWHVAFEKLSRTIWTPDRQSRWYYERSRGAYATEKMRVATARAKRIEFEKHSPRSQLITKTDLAKCWNAWNQLPEEVSKGGQKNFKKFTDALDDQLRRPELDHSEYKRIVGKVILYRDTTKLVNDLKDAIPAYRANVVAYLVAYLSFRMPQGIDFDRIWEKQAVPPKIREVIRHWAEPIYRHIVTTAGSRNVTEWCKSAVCWTELRGLQLSTDVDLARYGSPNGKAAISSGLVDVDDAHAISECLRLSPEEWENLMNWAMRADNMHWGARGVVSTLRSYALGNWERRPSVKQARSAARVIRRWREEDGP
ncbi:MAG: AIPR family protein [Gemmatimonadaceae bacterium]|nr:AIPR family protein [Gemmatimonadaceae bacterium]